MGDVISFTAQLSLLLAVATEWCRRREPADGPENTDERTVGRRRDLAGRLIASQELERTRIARELHDGVCQDVAAISVDISHLRQKRGELQSPDVQELLLSIQHRTLALAESLRRLSHGLHPSVLNHIGLVAALQSQCVEIERQHRMHVMLYADEKVQPANPSVALSLFRIAQEALANAAKHGRAHRASVSLARLGHDLVLSVADDGAGFDVLAARQNGGLGLVSMEERAHLAHGRVTIDSTPGSGTLVSVRVPADIADRPE